MLKTILLSKSNTPEGQEEDQWQRTCLGERFLIKRAKNHDWSDNLKKSNVIVAFIRGC